ncbi:MAG TPA: Cu(I)-responsive transcriptional regulator [Steroidobacteraceae bacterium]|nr:Cu(I)-responsive transcriptional regulator [Steroidobacteraceae bacterium]
MRRTTNVPRPELADARQRGYRNIGEASRLTGVTAKMIRHYEEIGLIPAAGRTFAGYRLYGEADLHRLRFIKRARSLGFSIEDIDTLLGLWGNPRRASRDVKRLAQAHVDALERKIQEMQAMQRTLQELAHRCHGDARPECPVLDDLAG